MCGRYRLTKRRMLEIEEYYGIDSIHELDLWRREFNIPPTEVAPIVFDHKGSRHLVQGLWSLVPPGTRRWKKSAAIHLQRQVRDAGGQVGPPGGKISAFSHLLKQ